MMYLIKIQNRFSSKPDFSGFNGGHFRNPHSVEINKPLRPNLPVVSNKIFDLGTLCQQGQSPKKPCKYTEYLAKKMGLKYFIKNFS